MSKHIYINQPLAERDVPASIINKLYNMCLRKINLLDTYDNTTNLIGTILTGYTFQEYIDIINEMFPQLNITPAGFYIYFEDPHVLSKLLDAGYGDEYENITTANAKTITFGNLFKNDTELISFNKFNLFTKQQGTSCSFEGCTNLNSINLSNLTGIPVNSMFKNCSSLTSIDNLGSITQISNGMFEKCSSLEHISIPSTVTTINSRSFIGCDSLHMTLQDLYNVTDILGSRDYGPWSSYNGQNSTTPSVIFEEETLDLPNLRRIGETAFAYQRFKYIDLPNNTYIAGVGTFRKCPNLIEVKSIGDSITQIMGDGITNGNNYDPAWRPGMFQDCTNLEKVTLPSGLTNLSQNMFSGCTKLHTLNLEEIKNNIIYIQNGALSGCNNLPRTFHFPNCIFFGLMTSLTRQQSLYLPKITYTFNPTTTYSSTNFNTAMFSYRGGISLFNTLYFKDIQTFGLATFANVTVTSIIINNVNPPQLSASKSSNESLNNIYESHIFARCNVTNIYVPDSAVDTYKTHELYTEYEDKIMPLSECPRITLEQSNDGIPGVIEAYMN